MARTCFDWTFLLPYSLRMVPPLPGGNPPELSRVPLPMADNRVRRTPTTTYPWNVNGHLDMDGGGCSAALISDNHVLTAAHCIHGGPGGGWAWSVYFTPGMDGDVQPYGRIYWDHVTTYACFTNVAWPDSIPCDMAVVRLVSSSGVGAATAMPVVTLTVPLLSTHALPLGQLVLPSAEIAHVGQRTHQIQPPGRK